MIRHAFKEWAVICRALAEGRQSLILRKGGIAEEGGIFRPEHARFWLYPTYVHQQRDGIKPEALPLLQAAQAEQPPSGTLRLSHFVDVCDTTFIDSLETALKLDPFHQWSPDTVTKRFAYREPGLFVLTVRVFRIPRAHDVPLKPEFDGCRTWVELDEALSIERAEPVLGERDHLAWLSRS